MDLTGRKRGLVPGREATRLDGKYESLNYDQWNLRESGKDQRYLQVGCLENGSLTTRCIERGRMRELEQVLAHEQR